MKDLTTHLYEDFKISKNTQYKIKDINALFSSPYVFYNSLDIYSYYDEYVEIMSEDNDGEEIPDKDSQAFSDWVSDYLEMLFDAFTEWCRECDKKIDRYLIYIASYNRYGGSKNDKEITFATDIHAIQNIVDIFKRGDYHEIQLSDDKKILRIKNHHHDGCEMYYAIACDETLKRALIGKSKNDGNLTINDTNLLYVVNDRNIYNHVVKLDPTI